RSLPARLLAGAYPVVTVFDIVVTGNHWFLDALGGVVICVLAAALVSGAGRLLGRHRAVAAGRPAAPLSLPNGSGDVDGGLSRRRHRRAQRDHSEDHHAERGQLEDRGEALGGESLSED